MTLIKFEYRAYEIHMKRLQQMKEDIVKMKQNKKDYITDEEALKLKIRLQKNKQTTHHNKLNERMVEILRQNELLLTKLFEIQHGGATQKVKYF